MKHTLKDLTDKDIEAALSSPNVTPNHKLDLTAEVLRRAAQADWDLVGDAFEDEAPECAECEFFFYQYWSDTGAETSCNLLEGDKGKPWMCPAYDRKKEEAEDA
tara:strand:+ start:109 stop:420 length:312 start_codon:yes stop_codon:yes gene_type:complete